MRGDEAPAPYEQRYCAFVDILGFSELIHNLGTGEMSANDLRSLLRTVHAPPPGENIKSFAGSDLRGQSISDALCLSAAHSSAGLRHLFFSLRELVLELLETGFFVRGAIVRGNLYHDDSMVFGEAFIRAYRLEQDVARYPRIMVTSDIVKEVKRLLKEGENNTWFSDLLQQAEDGPYYLHILNYFQRFFEARQEYPSDRIYMRTKCERIADHIQNRFDDSVDNPRHFEKVQWFARYWNRTLEQYAGEVTQISGPGLAREPAVWG